MNSTPSQNIVLLRLFSQVYGDVGVEGIPLTDFPLNYSSAAVAWVYGGLSSEILWLHIVIHGTVKPGATPSVRELGFFASEAVWELTYPIDPTPAILLVALFSIVLVILSPVLLYLDSSFSVITVFTPPYKKKNFSKVPYEISFCLLLDKIPPPSVNILFRIICPDPNSQFSIAWIRGNDYPKLFRRKRNYCSIILLTTDYKMDSRACLDVLFWCVEEDPLVGYPRILDPDKQPFNVQITDVRITNLETGEIWKSTHKYHAYGLGRKAVPYFLLPHEIRRITLKEFHVWPLLNTTLFKLLRCHSAVAMFFPPRNSQLRRIDRLLTVLFYVISGIVLAATIQIYRGISPPATVDPSEQLTEDVENGETIVISRGPQGLLALSAVSCLLSIPLSFLIRYVFVAEKNYREKRERAEDMQYEFCSHQIFFPLNVLRLPFMKVLSRPLATLLSVIIRNVPQAKTASRSQAKDTIFIDADRYLVKRWSFPELHEINEKRPFYDIAEVESLIPGMESRSQFRHGDWKLKYGGDYPATKLLKIRYSGVPPGLSIPPHLDLPDLPPATKVSSRDDILDGTRGMTGVFTEYSPVQPEEEVIVEESPVHGEQARKPGSRPLFIPEDAVPVGVDGLKDFDPALLHTTERQMTGITAGLDAVISVESIATPGLSYRHQQFDESGLHTIEHKVKDNVEKMIHTDDLPARLTIREKTFEEPIDAASNGSLESGLSEVVLISSEKSIPDVTMVYYDERDQQHLDFGEPSFEGRVTPDYFSVRSDESTSTLVLLEQNRAFTSDPTDYHPADIQRQKEYKTKEDDLFRRKPKRTVTTRDAATLSRSGFPINRAKMFPDRDTQDGKASTTSLVEDVTAFKPSSKLRSLLDEDNKQDRSSEKYDVAQYPDQGMLVSDTNISQYSVPASGTSKEKSEEESSFKSSLQLPSLSTDTEERFRRFLAEDTSVGEFWKKESDFSVAESSEKSEENEPETQTRLDEKQDYQKLFPKSFDQSSVYEDSINKLPSFGLKDSVSKVNKLSTVSGLTDEFFSEQYTTASEKTLFEPNKIIGLGVPEIRTLWSSEPGDEVESQPSTDEETRATTDSEVASINTIQDSFSQHSSDSEDEPSKGFEPREDSPYDRAYQLDLSSPAPSEGESSDGSSSNLVGDSSSNLVVRERDSRPLLNELDEIEIIDDDQLSSSAHESALAKTTGDSAQRGSRGVSPSTVESETSSSSNSQESSEEIHGETPSMSLGPHTAPFPSGFANRNMTSIRRIFPKSGREPVEEARSFRPLSHMNYFTLEEACDPCSGNPRLHHQLVTHVSQRDPVFPFPLQFNHLASLFVLSGIIALCIYLLWLGQNMSTNAAAPVYRGAFFSFFGTFVVGLLIDAIIGRYVFKEE